MAIEKYEVPLPDSNWSLDELRAWGKMSDLAKITTHRMGVAPTAYLATVEAEAIMRKAQGLPLLPA